jgi:hypothetical protein
MKKLLLSLVVILSSGLIIAQTVTQTATLKMSSRLFETKNDLTTVILVVPKGSVVTLLDSDSTYLHVIYEEDEGYIFRRHADINAATPAPAVAEEPAVQPQQQPDQQAQPQQEEVSRFTYLENKYGKNVAAKLMSGKIWKGMGSEMIEDSWGAPKKINRVISGNIVKEEWIYKNTWLYIENDILRQWGPIR